MNFKKLVNSMIRAGISVILGIVLASLPFFGDLLPFFIVLALFLFFTLIIKWSKGELK